MDVVFKEVTSIGGAICPEELASSVLFPIFVFALVAGIVGPDFLTFSMLLVLVPVTLVTCAVCVVVLPVAVGLVVLPVSVVYITVGVNESTSAICLICFPVSFIQRSVDPDLDSFTILAATLIPFTLVFCSIVQSDERSLDSVDTIGRWGGLILEGFQLVPDLHDKTACLHNLRI